MATRPNLPQIPYLPSFEISGIALTLCPLFAPAPLVLILLAACVLLFILLELKAIFSITYLVPICINNLPPGWVKKFCQKSMTQANIQKALVTTITLTLSAVSSSVYAATESMQCENSVDFVDYTIYMYMPSIVMLIVVGCSLFAGRLDNISRLLLERATTKHQSIRFIGLLLLPIRLVFEMLLAFACLFLLVPGIWTKMQVHNFGIMQSLDESHEIRSMHGVLIFLCDFLLLLSPF